MPSRRSELDAGVEAALLGLVLDLGPGHLNVSELNERLASEDPRRREEEEGVVERAVVSLKEAGLLDEKGGKIFPTRAAVRFDELPF